MATIDELNAASQAVASAVNDLIAKAQADAVVPDFQTAVDTLNTTLAVIQGYVFPPPPA